MDNKTIRLYLVCVLIYILSMYAAAFFITLLAPSPWYWIWSALFVFNAFASASTAGSRIDELCKKEEAKYG